jgi:hypothetical protein
MEESPGPTESATTTGRVGYCVCNCGKKTPLAKTTDRRVGRVKGMPVRYLPGHHRRLPKHYSVAWTGFKSPCWIWLLTRDAKGYGRVHHAGEGGKQAHRVNYEKAKGPIPSGLQIDHLCRMPACVNPDHLEAVTPAENVRRGRKTKLTEDDVAAIRASAEKQSELAQRYGVWQSQISRIKRNQSWRIPEPGPTSSSRAV